MNIYEIKSIEDIELLISNFGAEVLYRGQTYDYSKNGKLSIIPSMLRHGCIPQLTRKWHFYSTRALEEAGLNYESLQLNQALLQHYGWRSFYVDFSSKAEVACWFASHKFYSKMQTHLCEDEDEMDLCILNEKAEYHNHSGLSYLYVMNKTKPLESDFDLIDLSTLPETFFKRPRQQAGWLVGGNSSFEISNEVILAKIIGPAEIFRAYAFSKRVVSIEDLFPPPNEDLFYRLLLGLPWAASNTKPHVFQREMLIPDYYCKFSKRLTSERAYYKKTWLSEKEKDPEIRRWFRVHEDLFFSDRSSETLENVESIFELLQEGPIVIETDCLIQHVLGSNTAFLKGIHLSRQNNGIMLSPILVSYRGQTCEAVGISQPYYYEKNNEGSFTKVYHANQCECGNSSLHAYYAGITQTFIEHLPDMIESSSGVYTRKSNSSDV